MERSEQELIRREALKQIQQAGINPYPHEEFSVNITVREVLESFDADPGRFQQVRLAGRIMSRRIMGAVSFFVIQDQTGRIQLYLKRDELCPGENKWFYNEFIKKLLDIGDIIGVEGFVFRTNTGEITIHVRSLKLLCKSLRPLPIVKEKDGHVYDAFQDPELRYRMRYVDLIVNEHVKHIFIRRTEIINSMREFFNQHGYLEVETPILQPIPGGANARPFVTHHNALDIPLYLRIANELYLKRLLVGGFTGVYEFSKDFRNEGMDRFHNPEFTVLEIYVAYKDYHWMMNFTEDLLRYVINKLYGTYTIQYGGRVISFEKPFRRVTFLEAISEYSGYDVSEMDETALRDLCKQLHLEISPSMGKGKILDELFSHFCEQHFIEPTFVMDYPVEMSPLCKKHRSNPRLTERFELFINGREIANAYTELNDPIDQLERFREQYRLSQRGDDEAMFIDYDFVRALEYGMPPAAGMGIGIDRLVMLLTDQHSIQEVIFFPQMRPEQWNVGTADETTVVD